MKELDLMYALEGVEDALLRDAERFELRPRRRMLPRIAAAAAVLALLCGTVYAAVMSVKVDVTGKTWLHYNEELRGNVVYTDIEVEYDLTGQDIPAEAMDALGEYLLENWKARMSLFPRSWGFHEESFAAFGTVDERETGNVTFPGFRLDSLAEAEAFFGMTFALPDIVPKSGDDEVELCVLTPPLTERGGLTDYLRSIDADHPTDSIVPGFVEIRFGMTDPTGELRSIGGSIILALDEASAEHGYTYEFASALDYLGEPEFLDLDIDGLDGRLVTFPQAADTASVEAFYTCGGVGYALYAVPAEGIEVEDPAQLLLPWLEQLG